MKKILLLSILLGALVSLQGCTDWLTIKPENDIVLEDFWQTEEDVNQIVNGCYRAMLEDGFMERMMCWGELRSDNAVVGSGMNYDMFQMCNGDITSSNYLCGWGSAYHIINICNSFLYYGHDVTQKDSKFTEDEYLQLESQVLTIRALVYFYLVRAYKEVPWIDMPSIDDTQNYRIPKSTEDVVLDNIVADLKRAESNAPDAYGDNVNTKGRITLNAVRSLLADIYLWRGQFSECVDNCNLVLADKSLKLVNAEQFLYSVFYVKNSSESIFELQFDEDIQFNNMVKSFYGSNNNYAGSWAFNSTLVSGISSPFNKKVGSIVESEFDIRAEEFFVPMENYYVFKYAGVNRVEKSGSATYNYRDNTANWIVYRLADVMLMKAEALVQLSSGTSELEEALKLVNTTYLRSNPTGADSLKLESFNSSIQMEELVLRERQRELMFEGKRWFDLVRLARRANSPSPILGYVNKGSSSSTGNQGASKLSTMDAVYLPIHIDELSANNALVQNPFYDVTDDSSSSK